MFTIGEETNTAQLFKERREKLASLIKEKYPDKTGTIILFSGFERDDVMFNSESNFYYFTGINEPASVVLIDADGNSILFIPRYKDRSKWIDSEQSIRLEHNEILGFQAIDYLGSEMPGFHLTPFFSQESHQSLLSHPAISNSNVLYAVNTEDKASVVEHVFFLNRLKSYMANQTMEVINISDISADMRRIKDKAEIESLYEAIEITEMAHEAAAQAIEQGVNESEIQASLEYIMIASHARPAFTSIVATGKNGTVLHYTRNKTPLKNGDLVVIDIGAKVNGYCADITRTYPVSGKFTKRQSELYSVVLETQEYIASLARPGYWLNNKSYPKKSLHHLAIQFLKEKGYDQYFIHGIGHYLGLDVHDVGSYASPLQAGDVITIEPGIYIPQENIGIRIEDNYWIIEDGAICLSEHLPKSIGEIEALMQHDCDEDGKEEIVDPLSQLVADQGKVEH